MNSRTLQHFIPVFMLLAAALACAMPTGPITPTLTAPVFPTQAPAATATPTQPAPLPTSPPAQPTAVVPTATSPAPVVTQVTFYLVALEDNGKGGIQIGCGDSLVAVTQPVDPTDSPVKVALERLFSYKTQIIGESGLYTALYQSNLQVDSVDVGPAGDVNVVLSGMYAIGGVCDNPRFQGQIEETIKVSSGASAVNVVINGKPLREIVSGR